MDIPIYICIYICISLWISHHNPMYSIYIYSIYPYGYPSPSGFFTPSSSVLRCYTCAKGTCAKGTGKHQAAKADTAKSLRRGMITTWWRWLAAGPKQKKFLDHRKSWIYHRFTIGNPRFTIGNPRFTIGNPRFTIGNPRFTTITTIHNL
jgi:hypothetical protein